MFRSISKRIQKAIDRLPWRRGKHKPQPEPEPKGPEFRWEPQAEHITVSIPAALQSTQLTLFTRWRHKTIYGPDRDGVRVDDHIVYTIPGNGNYWAAKAAEIGPESGQQILCYVNTASVQELTGHASAGWRILYPQRLTVGEEGIRLQKGEDK